MGVFTIIAIVLTIGIIGFVIARGRAISVADGDTSVLHSRPGYHGSYALVFAVLPALALVAIWLVVSPIVVQQQVVAGFPAEVQEGPQSGRDLAMGQVRSIGEGIRLLSFSLVE